MTMSITGDSRSLHIHWTDNEWYVEGNASSLSPEFSARNLELQNTRTALSVYRQGSRSFLNLLNLERTATGYGGTPVIERFDDLRTLVSIGWWRSEPYVSIMLERDAFDFFGGYCRDHLSEPFKYRLQFGFPGFPVNAAARAYLEEGGLFISLSADFHSGKSCFLLDTNISFDFSQLSKQNTEPGES